MTFTPLHPWDLSPAAAIGLQEKLRSRVERRDRLDRVRLIAGVDASYEEERRLTRAAVAVLTFPELETCDQAVARAVTRFPYVPGLLSFREIPAILEALKKLERLPDLLLCDAQGYAHPRRFGLACHLGLWTDIPSVGVAKSRFVGRHGDVPAQRGGWCPLVDGGEVVGAVLRTRERVKPVYVSVGHRISLETAVAYVLRATAGFRLPETTRRAHSLAAVGNDRRPRTVSRST